MALVGSLAYAVQASISDTRAFIGPLDWSGRSGNVIRRAMLSAGQIAVAVCTWHGGKRQYCHCRDILCISRAAHPAVGVNLYCVAQMFAGPRAAGSWVGVQNAMGNIAGIVGPIISGVLIDRAGYGSAFALAAGIVAFGGFWWALALPLIRRIDFDR
jgi:predicted MFS family arabinose efflux permease